MTSTAKPRPSRPSVVRLSIDSSTYGPWSKTTSTALSELSPSARPSSGSFAAMSCEIATALPSGDIVTDTPRLVLPSVRVMVVASARSRSIVATSPSFTGLSGLGLTTGCA